MNKCRLPQMIQRLALLCVLAFAGFASASWPEGCGPGSPCSSCTLGGDCQATLSASANLCCALGAASLLPGALGQPIIPNSRDVITAADPARLSGRSLAPPLPPPRSL